MQPPGWCLPDALPGRMKIIEPSTPDEIQRYYDLRWKILRAPWNQPCGSERDELESSSRHLMVINSKQAVIAVGRLHFNSIREAQIRYMAVDIAHAMRSYANRPFSVAISCNSSRVG